MTKQPTPHESRQTPVPECLYDLAVIRTDTTRRKLTGYPMTHAECVTMKSKFSDEEQARIIFVPSQTMNDPDHGPMGNAEASLSAEIEYLKEKLAIAQDAQNNIWKANIRLAQQARQDHASSLARIAALERALTDLLFAFENADETGYVTDVGFIKDFDGLADRCRLALAPAAGKGGK